MHTISSTQHRSTLSAQDVQTYICDGYFFMDSSQFGASADLKSGYANLDMICSLYPGLYVIGANSSLGKTTMMHQMADQIAEAGHSVLYFSLEQSRLELVSKSLSRFMASEDPDHALTSLQIRKKAAAGAPRVNHASDEYISKCGQRLTIVEGSFATTIDEIENFTRNFIDEHKCTPVVFIDYLQAVKLASDIHVTDKERIDIVVQRLKQLQKEKNLVLIVISSLNRSNYLSVIDFESFKESGGIEYTADVIWGLQLQAIHNDIFSKANYTNEKREAIRKAKRATPRKLEFVCLKNRFGISSYSLLFDYYPRFDRFVPDMGYVDEAALAVMEEDGEWIDYPEGAEPPVPDTKEESKAS